MGKLPIGDRVLLLWAIAPEWCDPANLEDLDADELMFLIAHATGRGAETKLLSHSRSTFSRLYSRFSHRAANFLLSDGFANATAFRTTKVAG